MALQARTDFNHERDTPLVALLETTETCRYRHCLDVVSARSTRTRPRTTDVSSGYDNAEIVDNKRLHIESKIISARRLRRRTW